MKKVLSLLHNEVFLFIAVLCFIFCFVAVVVTYDAIINGVHNEAASSIIAGLDMLAAVGILVTYEAAKL